MHKHTPRSRLDHKKSTKESPLIQVTKILNAPANRIFQALSHSELVKQWWGPEGFECPTIEMDFKIGGKYLFCMRSEDDGKEVWSTGHFLVVDENRRIVLSDFPANSNGEVLPSVNSNTTDPVENAGESFITFELDTQEHERTKLILSHEGLPARIHDECVQGWISSLEKLKKFVESH